MGHDELARAAGAAGGAGRDGDRQEDRGEGAAHTTRAAGAPGPGGARRFHVVVVGVCASGKSTLKAGLQRLGYSVASVAQEHTLVKRLWRRSEPDVLIVLDCSHATIRARRQNPVWPKARFDAQQERLADARRHADILIQTDGLTPAQLVDRARQALLRLGVRPPIGTPDRSGGAAGAGGSRPAVRRRERAR